MKDSFFISPLCIRGLEQEKHACIQKLQKSNTGGDNRHNLRRLNCQRLELFCPFGPTDRLRRGRRRHRDIHRQSCWHISLLRQHLRY